VGVYGRLEVGIVDQLRERPANDIVVLANGRCLASRRGDGEYEVLVRAECAGLDQLRHTDLLVDRATELFIAQPLDSRRVVRGCARQGNESQTVDPLGHPRQ